MNVKEYSVNELVPGMIIAAPVITNAGQILLDVGVTLTRPLIEKIAFYQIPSVTIEVVTGTEEKNRRKRSRRQKKPLRKRLISLHRIPCSTMSRRLLPTAPARRPSLLIHKRSKKVPLSRNSRLIFLSVPMT